MLVLSVSVWYTVNRCTWKKSKRSYTLQ